MTLSKFECKIHIGIPDASLINAKLATLSVYSIDKLAHTRATDKN